MRTHMLSPTTLTSRHRRIPLPAHTSNRVIRLKRVSGQHGWCVTALGVPEWRVGVVHVLCVGRNVETRVQVAQGLSVHPHTRLLLFLGVWC